MVTLANPKPGYPQFARTNSSRYLRAYMRGLWAKGEQRWDKDVDQNFSWFGYWTPQQAIYRLELDTQQMPPWYSPYYVKLIWDPKHSVPQPPGDETAVDTVYEATRTWASWAAPIEGASAYIFADRMMVMYSGGEWKPIARLVDRKFNCEIAICAVGLKANMKMVSKVMDQPIRIYAQNNQSRMRGGDYRYTYPLRKNGVDIGVVFQGKFTSGCSVEFDTDFAKGDVLSIDFPAGATRDQTFAVSLLGEYLL